jgi:hypothetical protein
LLEAFGATLFSVVASLYAPFDTKRALLFLMPGHIVLQIIGGSSHVQDFFGVVGEENVVDQLVIPSICSIPKQ